MATTPKPADLSTDPRFSFGAAPIQTAQDAALAYLQGVITEEEFRAAVAKYGVVEPYTLFQHIDVGAYEVTLPDDLAGPPIPTEDTVKTRIEAVEAKQEVQENEELPPAVELTTESSS